MLRTLYTLSSEGIESPLHKSQEIKFNKDMI